MPSVLETRQQVVTALLSRLQGMTFSAAINGKTTWQNSPALMQRLKLWGDVPVDQQPAMYLVTHREMDEYRGLGLERRRLEFGAWCYCRTDDPNILGQVYLDTMMEAFEAALAPDDFSKNQLTFNGLVYWCRIEGRVFKDPGDIDNQAMMIVPIVIEMP